MFNAIVRYICRWSFLHSAEVIRKQEFSETLPRASVRDLGVILMGAGYEVIISYPDVQLSYSFFLLDLLSFFSLFLRNLNTYIKYV